MSNEETRKLVLRKCYPALANRHPKHIFQLPEIMELTGLDAEIVKATILDLHEHGMVRMMEPYHVGGFCFEVAGRDFCEGTLD